VLDQITQQLKQVSKGSQIQAGQTEQRRIDSDQATAINQIFELFRFNYHNQFLKAFPDLDTLNMAKKLWARLLMEYPAQVVMAAAEQCVKKQKFLPNVHDVIEECETSAADLLGMPDAHSAYVEACRAPSPKAEYNWTHPAVYYAGRASDWFLLANEPEQIAFPVFERNYQLLMAKVKNGESIEIDLPKALPEETTVPLEKKQQLERLKAMRAELNLD